MRSSRGASNWSPFPLGSRHPAWGARGEPAAPLEQDTTGARGEPAAPLEQDTTGARGEPAAPLEQDTTGARGEPAAPLEQDQKSLDPRVFVARHRDDRTVGHHLPPAVRDRAFEVAGRDGEVHTSELGDLSPELRIVPDDGIGVGLAAEDPQAHRRVAPVQGHDGAAVRDHHVELARRGPDLCRDAVDHGQTRAQRLADECRLDRLMVQESGVVQK